MPEAAEVKITSEFITKYAHGRKFVRIEKSPESKVKTYLSTWDEAAFIVKAKSRGKEILIECEKIGGEKTTSSIKTMLVTLGMSGTWVYLSDDITEGRDQYLKHMHLRFITDDGGILGMIDVRRFAKWKWVKTWSINRGPCPLTEYEKFKLHLTDTLSKNRAKKIVNRDKHSDLCEVLMDQSVFNGVGNYLRAEILFRADINPFQKFYETTHEEINEIAKITHDCIRTAYELGGGQLKDWKNPDGVSATSFKDWIKCYSRPDSLSKMDRQGRRIWYNPKWSY